MNELGKVFDGVDIVVRRWRDQTNSGSRVTRLGDPRINFGARQLTTLTGLRALRHLDLYFLGVDQILAGHTEATGRHLLNGGVLGITVRQNFVPLGVFTALAGVALTTDTVHGDRKRLVRFLTDRAIAHGAGLEALHDALDRLDLIKRYGFTLLEGEQATQGR